jgi:hypothetical protein
MVRTDRIEVALDEISAGHAMGQAVKTGRSGRHLFLIASVTLAVFGVSISSDTNQYGY